MASRLYCIAGVLGACALLAGTASLLALAPTRGQDAEAVRVEAGPFVMGSDDGPADERPAHTLDLPAFEIDRLPVTTTQFAAFLAAVGPRNLSGQSLFDVDDPDARIHRRGDQWLPDPGFEQHPVVEASWPGA